MNKNFIVKSLNLIDQNTGSSFASIPLQFFKFSRAIAIKNRFTSWTAGLNTVNKFQIQLFSSMRIRKNSEPLGRKSAKNENNHTDCI